MAERLRSTCPMTASSPPPRATSVHAQHLPTEGEHFSDQGWRFEVVDMDGRKIDKLLVSEAVSP